MAFIFVGCNKELRTIKGEWKVVQHSYRSEGTENWQEATWASPNLKVTKSTWEPYIEGKCVVEGEHVLPEVATDFTYAYDYIESIDELRLNMFKKSDGDWIKKLVFERL